MSTGTIQEASKTLFKDQESNALYKSYTAASDLKEGQPVAIAGDGVVDVAGAADFPIGVVTTRGVRKGEDNTGAFVTVLCGYMADGKALAQGSTLAAGDFVRHNGTVTASGLPQYITAAAASYANAIVLVGGASGEEIRIGILKTPILVA